MLCQCLLSYHSAQSPPKAQECSLHLYTTKSIVLVFMSRRYPISVQMQVQFLAKYWSLLIGPFLQNWQAPLRS